MTKADEVKRLAQAAIDAALLHATRGNIYTARCLKAAEFALDAAIDELAQVAVLLERVVDWYQVGSTPLRPQEVASIQRHIDSARAVLAGAKP